MASAAINPPATEGHIAETPATGRLSAAHAPTAPNPRTAANPNHSRRIAMIPATRAISASVV